MNKIDTYTLERILYKQYSSQKLFLSFHEKTWTQEQHQTTSTAQTVTLNKWKKKVLKSEISFQDKNLQTSLPISQPSLHKEKTLSCTTSSKQNTGLPSFPKTLAIYCLTITVYTKGRGDGTKAPSRVWGTMGANHGGVIRRSIQASVRGRYFLHRCLSPMFTPPLSTSR